MRSNIPVPYTYRSTPKATELGITVSQRRALIEIRRLEAQLIETLSYFSVAENATRIARIEELMERHFPGELERLQAARRPAQFPTESEPLAENALAS